MSIKIEGKGAGERDRAREKPGIGPSLHQRLRDIQREGGGGRERESVVMGPSLHQRERERESVVTASETFRERERARGDGAITASETPRHSERGRERERAWGWGHQICREVARGL